MKINEILGMAVVGLFFALKKLSTEVKSIDNKTLITNVFLYFIIQEKFRKVK